MYMPRPRREYADAMTYIHGLEINPTNEYSHIMDTVCRDTEQAVRVYVLLTRQLPTLVNVNIEHS